MSFEVSVHELRNNTAKVVAAIYAGEEIVLTSNHRPIADIVPHTPRRNFWVPAAALCEIVQESAADGALLNDIAEVHNALVD